MRNEIVVGLDDSPSSRAALDWAAEQARGVGAVLRAVHVLDWPYGLSSAGFPGSGQFHGCRAARSSGTLTGRRWLQCSSSAVTR